MSAIWLGLNVLRLGFMLLECCRCTCSKSHQFNTDGKAVVCNTTYVYHSTPSRLILDNVIFFIWDSSGSKCVNYQQNYLIYWMGSFFLTFQVFTRKRSLRISLSPYLIMIVFHTFLIFVYKRYDCFYPFAIGPNLDAHNKYDRWLIYIYPIIVVSVRLNNYMQQKKDVFTSLNGR